MKRRIITIIIIIAAVTSVVAFVASLPSLDLYFFMGHYINNGIEKYYPAASSYGLCAYLEVRDETKLVPEHCFCWQYRFSKAFYRREEANIKPGLEHETVVMVLKYEPSIYETALGDIANQPGFSNEFSFTFNGFNFYLNDTERVDSIERATYISTNYCLDGDNQYIGWINLVGYSDVDCTIVFVGYFHCYKWRSGFWKYDQEYYKFEGWDSFFESEFSFIDWLR